MTAGDASAAQADGRPVGLVVVHGIGDHSLKRGDTAREVLDAIDLVATRPDREQAASWSDEEGAPTHTMVRRCLGPDGSVTELLVVDAWWDDVVAVESGLPRRLRTWGWSLRIAPLLLATSSVMGMAAAVAKELESPRGVGPPRLVMRARNFVTAVPPRTWQTMLQIMHSALLRFLVLPPLLLVLLLVGPVLLQVVDLVWCRLTRSERSPAGRALDLGLQLTLGDAWAFVDDPDRRARILRRVTEVLAWTRERCGPVTLLGHSQGGAISRAVLASGGSADQLVTIGSGANLLGVLFNTARKPIVSLITWVMLLTYPALVATALSRLVQDWTTSFPIIFESLRSFIANLGPALDGSQVSDLFGVLYTQIELFFISLGPLLGLLAGVALFSLLARLLMGPVRFDPSTLQPDVASWWDVSSRYDPVCVGGHVVETDAHGVEVVNASTLRQVAGEHVAYFRNPAVGEVISAAIASMVTGRPPAPQGAAARDPGRWHRALNGYWWWGLPVTLCLTVAALRCYSWLIGSWFGQLR